MPRNRSNVLTWAVIVFSGAFLLAGAESRAAVLHDNGPLITHPGGGFGGADASAVQTSLGLLSRGWNVFNFSLADDFTVGEIGGWDIDSITFFAYEVNSGTIPTINSVYYQIWNGAPDAVGSSVVFGDTATNRIASAVFSNMYRVYDTDLTNAERPVMAVKASAGFHLAPGTYWIEVYMGSVTLNIVWVPTVTILGSTTTGNAMGSSGGWHPITDTGTGTQLGIPFILEGTKYTVLITSISSRTSKPGSVATIHGSGFSTNKTKNVVYFGTKKATVSRAKATSLRVTIPRLKKKIYDVIAVVDGSPSKAFQFQVK